MSEAGSKARRRVDFYWDVAVVVLACVVAMALAVTSMRQKSVTYDELTYIPAGYSYWATGDFRLNAEHPPLAKLLAGAAAQLAEPGRSVHLPGWEKADQWTFGQVFLLRLGAKVESFVFWARLPTVVLFGLLVLGTALFARQLYGRRAGSAAAALTALAPGLLAHARLATNDLPVTCFTLWTLFGVWRYRLRPSWQRLWLPALSAGLAVASKFTALLLAPTLMLWTLVFASSWPSAPRPLGDRLAATPAQKTLAHVLALLASSAVALFVVSATYFAPFDLRPFVHSLGHTYPGMVRDYGEYLHGQFSRSGFPEYFVVAFLVKTTLALLLLIVLRVAYLAVRAERDSREARALLLLPVLAWTLAATFGAIQFGVRYLLPVYPLLIVWVSSLAEQVTFEKHARAAVVVAVVWQFHSALSIHPHYLTYFNELAGGPRHGIEWLDDSNIDWGQDLPAVRDYLAAHPRQPAYITTMSTVPPSLYGIDASWVTPGAVVAHLDPKSPERGLYVVSIHVLNRIRYWYPEAPVDPLHDLEPVAILANTFYVYDISRSGAARE